jgi:porphobilinogen synthase
MSTPPPFAFQRFRRLRQQGWLRDLVQENHLHVEDLIWPVFVIEGQGQREPVASMPGVERLSPDLLVEEAKRAADLGIRALMLFPCLEPSLRDDKASQAFAGDNLVCRTVKALKKACPTLGIITDVALDPYSSHGHDGFLRDGQIENDLTVVALCRQALIQAEAGCDILAPSDMMDGRIQAIRTALDEKGLIHVPLMSYTAKYASAFYGPFREAVKTGGLLKGDKKTYQMNPANGQEALHEAVADDHEGADLFIVKPGLPYLDIVASLSQTLQKPVFAYQVSGEYAMIEAAAAQGWLERDAVILETALAFKRAGASGLMTYHAPALARLLKA